MRTGATDDLLPDSTEPYDRACVVELRAARIPAIGWFAHHHWLVVAGDGRQDRWEVWWLAHAGGTAWGHLHRNLLPPTNGVGSGPSWVLHTWDSSSALALAASIEASPLHYPYRDRYLPWPGPNSNTYVQWILGDRFHLGRKAVGRGFAKRRP